MRQRASGANFNETAIGAARPECRFSETDGHSGSTSVRHELTSVRRDRTGREGCLRSSGKDQHMPHVERRENVSGRAAECQWGVLWLPATDRDQAAAPRYQTSGPTSGRQPAAPAS
jgi:hypothetical protein